MPEKSASKRGIVRTHAEQAAGASARRRIVALRADAGGVFDGVMALLTTAVTGSQRAS